MGTKGIEPFTQPPVYIYGQKFYRLPTGIAPKCGQLLEIDVLLCAAITLSPPKYFF
jgi:hypothetical protein